MARTQWVAAPAKRAVQFVLDQPLRVPVKMTTAVGVRSFRPLNETAFVEAAYHRVRNLPVRTVWQTRHRADRALLTAWKMKNVNLPYWRKSLSR